MAGQAFNASSLTSATSSRGSERARTVSAPRYTRSPTFAPRSTCHRGSGAAACSIGSVVIGGDGSRPCVQTVKAGGKKKTPPPATPPQGGGGGGGGGCPRPARP